MPLYSFDEQNIRIINLQNISYLLIALHIYILYGNYRNNAFDEENEQNFKYFFVNVITHNNTKNETYSIRKIGINSLELPLLC